MGEKYGARPGGLELPTFWFVDAGSQSLMLYRQSLPGLEPAPKQFIGSLFINHAQKQLALAAFRRP
jgi:hypothetical protein